jgi:hypothetical protein
MNSIIKKTAEEINHELIVQAKKNVDLIHIKNLIPSTTKWEEFIAHCNFLEKNRDITLESPVKLIGALQIWDDFFLAGYYAQRGDIFSQWDEITKKTDNLFGRENDGGCTLINFIGGEKTIPVHTDTRDSFLWQAIGTVEWRIHETENPESLYKILIVEPGDVLFVPSGISHTVFCPDPRAALSIFYDKKE